MHIKYFTSKSISSKDIFNGRLVKYNIHELITGETTKYCRYLTDFDNNKLTVVIDDQNCAANFILSELNQNSPWIILDAIANEFDSDIQKADELVDTLYSDNV